MAQLHNQLMDSHPRTGSTRLLALDEIGLTQGLTRQRHVSTYN